MTTFRVIVPFEIEASDAEEALREIQDRIADDHGLLYAEIAVLEVAPAS